MLRPSVAAISRNNRGLVASRISAYNMGIAQNGNPRVPTRSASNRSMEKSGNLKRPNFERRKEQLEEAGISGNQKGTEVSKSARKAATNQ